MEKVNKDILIAIVLTEGYYAKTNSFCLYS